MGMTVRETKSGELCRSELASVEDKVGQCDVLGVVDNEFEDSGPGNSREGVGPAPGL